MNVTELRYLVTQWLSGGRRSAVGIDGVELIPPAPGEPLSTEVTAVDPYTPGHPVRRFRITFEEIT